MCQPIRLNYIPGRQDYARVLRIYFWRRTSTKVSLGVLIIAFGLVAYTILSKGAPPTLFELIWLFLPPLFVGYVLAIQPARVANQAAKNEQLITEATWEISETGVNISSRFGSNLSEWSSLDKLVTTSDYYLLLSKNNKNAFRFLPRRAFTSAQEETEFRELVARHISLG